MADRVKDACEREYDAHKGDCSGFARAVGAEVGVPIAGLADQMVNMLRAGGAWRPIADGPAAAARARAGKLVLAGLRGDEQFHHSNHGHVVVVVDGPMAHGRYPTAYWGSLGGTPAKFETINWAWTDHDRDRVSYAEHDVA
jgi:hypothetical protein